MSATTFKQLSVLEGGQPRKNSKGRFDRRSWVVAVVTKLFCHEPEHEQQRLIELHCGMKPSDHFASPKRCGLRADDPDVYSALASMTEKDRDVFETLWTKASEAQEARKREDASTAEPEHPHGDADAQGPPPSQEQPPASQDLGEEPKERVPPQRTDFRTPAHLRMLLPGGGKLGGSWVTPKQRLRCFVLQDARCIRI